MVQIHERRVVGYSLLIEKEFETASVVAAMTLIGPAQVTGRIGIWVFARAGASGRLGHRRDLPGRADGAGCSAPELSTAGGRCAALWRREWYHHHRARSFGPRDADSGSVRRGQWRHVRPKHRFVGSGSLSWRHGLVAIGQSRQFQTLRRVPEADIGPWPFLTPSARSSLLLLARSRHTGSRAGSTRGGWSHRAWP